MSERLLIAWIRLTTPQSEDGASAAEYGLLIAGIATLIVAVVYLFGDAVMGLFTGTCKSIRDGATGHITADC